MASVTDYYLVYRFIKALVTPFKKTKAYRLGIIDDKGNILKKMKDLETSAEKQAYGRFERMIWNLKKVLYKVPFLSKNFISIAAASLLLLKEERNYENTYAKYLMEAIEFLNAGVSVASIKKLEMYTENVFGNVEGNKRFFDGINSGEQITNSDFIRIFNNRYSNLTSSLSENSYEMIREMELDGNIPFVFVRDKETEEINLMAKTITKKRGFKVVDQRLTLEAMPATNASSGNFAGLPPDDPPVSKSAQKKHRKRNKKKRKKFSDYTPRAILDVK